MLFSPGRLFVINWGKARNERIIISQWFCNKERSDTGALVMFGLPHCDETKLSMYMLSFSCFCIFTRKLCSTLTCCELQASIVHSIVFSCGVVFTFLVVYLALSNWLYWFFQNVDIWLLNSNNVWTSKKKLGKGKEFPALK